MTEVKEATMHHRHHHVVMFSGGLGSWAAARRVAREHGTDNLTLLFTDTLIEDQDLYRFIKEAAANIGGRFVHVGDGRDPWQVFHDVKYLGNSRTAHCSIKLKQVVSRRWVEKHFKPSEVTIYLGIDWTEEHRSKAVRKGWKPYNVEFPLCKPPMRTKSDYLQILTDCGIRPPRLYCVGFPHNNCGGFCVRAGQASFALLLKSFPERYAYHEKKELEFREWFKERNKRDPFVVANVSIMLDRRNYEKKPMTLKTFRERLEAGGKHDAFDWGGCACFA